MCIHCSQGNDLGAQTNGLLVHRLPCAEDVRDYNFPSLVTFVGANRYVLYPKMPACVPLLCTKKQLDSWIP